MHHAYCYDQTPKFYVISYFNSHFVFDLCYKSSYAKNHLEHQNYDISALTVLLLDLYPLIQYNW